MHIFQINDDILSEVRWLSRLAVAGREPIREERGKERGVRTLTDHFELSKEEFEEITVEDYYREVGHLIRALLRPVRRIMRKKDVGVRFFKFNVPESTANRRVLKVETDTFFFCLVVEPATIHGKPYVVTRVTIKGKVIR